MVEFFGIAGYAACALAVVAYLAHSIAFAKG